MKTRIKTAILVIVAAVMIAFMIMPALQAFAYVPVNNGVYPTTIKTLGRENEDAVNVWITIYNDTPQTVYHDFTLTWGGDGQGTHYREDYACVPGATTIQMIADNITDGSGFTTWQLTSDVIIPGWTNGFMIMGYNRMNYGDTPGAVQGLEMGLYSEYGTPHLASGYYYCSGGSYYGNADFYDNWGNKIGETNDLIGVGYAIGTPVALDTDEWETGIHGILVRDANDDDTLVCSVSGLHVYEPVEWNCLDMFVYQSMITVGEDIDIVVYGDGTSGNGEALEWIRITDPAYTEETIYLDIPVIDGETTGASYTVTTNQTGYYFIYGNNETESVLVVEETIEPVYNDFPDGYEIVIEDIMMGGSGTGDMYNAENDPANWDNVTEDVWDRVGSIFDMIEDWGDVLSPGWKLAIAILAAGISYILLKEKDKVLRYGIPGAIIIGAIISSWIPAWAVVLVVIVAVIVGIIMSRRN